MRDHLQLGPATKEKAHFSTFISRSMDQRWVCWKMVHVNTSVVLQTNPNSTKATWKNGFFGRRCKTRSGITKTTSKDKCEWYSSLPDENISSIKVNDSFITPNADHAMESDFWYFLLKNFCLQMSGGLFALFSHNYVVKNAMVPGLYFCLKELIYFWCTINPLNVKNRPTKNSKVHRNR